MNPEGFMRYWKSKLHPLITVCTQPMNQNRHLQTNPKKILKNSWKILNLCAQHRKREREKERNGILSQHRILSGWQTSFQANHSYALVRMGHLRAHREEVWEQVCQQVVPSFLRLAGQQWIQPLDLPMGAYMTMWQAVNQSFPDSSTAELSVSKQMFFIVRTTEACIRAQQDRTGLLNQLIEVFSLMAAMRF